MDTRVVWRSLKASHAPAASPSLKSGGGGGRDERGEGGEGEVGMVLLLVLLLLLLEGMRVLRWAWRVSMRLEQSGSFWEPEVDKGVPFVEKDPLKPERQENITGCEYS